MLLNVASELVSDVFVILERGSSVSRNVADKLRRYHQLSNPWLLLKELADSEFPRNSVTLSSRRGIIITRIDELLAFDQAVARGEDPRGNATGEPGLFEADDPVFSRLAGFDEAGRGALAGPVTVACVSFPNLHQHEMGAALREQLADLDDSKRLTAKRREALEPAIRDLSTWGIGWASAKEIDAHGIVEACRRAAQRALRSMGSTIDLCLFDRGLRLPGLSGVEFTRGDARSLHIAAASILAKTARDRVLRSLDVRFPGYGLAQHKGYGTKAHSEAIRHQGTSRIHRRTFCGRKSRRACSVDTFEREHYTRNDPEPPV